MKIIISILLLAVLLTAAMSITACADTGVGIEPGQTMPDFTASLTDGTTVTLSELLAEKDLVVLNLFASRCGPCEREFPEMDAVRLENPRMEIVAVSFEPTDTMEIIADYKESHGLSFPMGLKGGALPQGLTLLQDFLGQVGGSMGEISAFALLLGGCYLLVRKIISPRIPLAFLGTVAVLTFLFPQGNPRLGWMLWQLCSGGVMLGAIFMATDYTTSPVNPTAQLVFGVGCGALTVFIRYFGSYAEGVSYAILIMNAAVWLLDKAFPNKRFGTVKKKEAA